MHACVQTLLFLTDGCLRDKMASNTMLRSDHLHVYVFIIVSLKVPNTLSLFKGIKTQTGDSLHTTR